MRRPVAALLDDLLALVAADCPAALAAIAARAAGLTVAVALDAEAIAVEVDAGGPRLRPVGAGAAVRVEVSAGALRGLIMGDLDAVDALRDERARVFGDAEDCVRLEAMVRLLTAGAARSRGAGRLLDEFLAGVGGPGAVAASEGGADV